MKRGRNAAIHANLVPLQQAKIALNVSTEFATAGATNQEAQLTDKVLKATRAKITKQVPHLIKSQRKNSLGGVKFQTSKPTESGQNSSRKSKKSAKQRKQQQQQQEPKKQDPKKSKKKKENKENKENKGTSGTESRGSYAGNSS